MQDFKNLKVWRKSHALTLEVYRAVQGFPQEERFGLARQLKGAAVSVESNLAEGSARSGDSDFRRFAWMSLGSVCEVECQLIISRDLSFLPAAGFERLHSACQEVRRMLVALIRRLAVTTSPTSRRRSRRKLPDERRPAFEA